MHRAGVIGLGLIGEWHTRKYAEAEGVDPVAIADVDADNRASVGEEYGVPEAARYADHVELLRNESLDVVSIASPSVFHREHVLDTLEHGAPDVIFCEKPIATAVADGTEMVQACREADVELLVNHSRRWAPEIQALRRHLEEREPFGELRSVHVDWPRELLRNGTHAVDLLYHLLDPITRVSGHLTGEADVDPPIDIDDVGGGGHLVTNTGTFVTLNATLPRASLASELSLIGTEGRVRVDMGSGEIACHHRTDGEWRPTAFDGLDAWTSDGEQYFDAAMGDIVGMLDGEDVPNRSPGTEATDVLELVVALFVSGYTGSTVDLPIEPPLRDVAIDSW